MLKDENLTKEDILEQISSDVRKAMDHFNYDFQDRCNSQDEWKFKLIDAFMDISPDKTITEHINKTGFPDAVVMKIIRMHGVDINSIDELIEVRATFAEGPESNTLGVTIHPTFKNRHWIDVDVKYDQSNGGILCE